MIVFSGVAPSGNLHIGNYIGAIRQWVAGQDQKQNIFCVVDLHAITTPQDPRELYEKTREVAAIYLACGVDPQKSAIFVQSHNPHHAQLAWILDCVTPMGWLQRMTQYKEKSKSQKEVVSVGLFNYPALMAADILLYQTDEVPVGEDQKQHIEYTRDVAERFNKTYQEVFKLPKARIDAPTARIMSLQDPNSKMSKSDPNDLSRLNLLDPLDLVSEKVRQAVTDSGNEIRRAPDKPALSNLLTIYAALTDQPIERIEQDYSSVSSYQEFKQDLAEVVIEFLRPIQQKYRQIRETPEHLDTILAEGLQKVKPLSQATLTKVQRAVGLG